MISIIICISIDMIISISISISITVTITTSSAFRFRGKLSHLLCTRSLGPKVGGLVGATPTGDCMIAVRVFAGGRQAVRYTNIYLLHVTLRMDETHVMDVAVVTHAHTR